MINVQLNWTIPFKRYYAARAAVRIESDGSIVIPQSIVGRYNSDQAMRVAQDILAAVDESQRRAGWMGDSDAP